jgi:hypothetical protein
LKNHVRMNPMAAATTIAATNIMMLVPIMLLTIDAECPANKQEAMVMER